MHPILTLVGILLNSVLPSVCVAETSTQYPPATFEFVNLTPQFRIRIDGRDYTEGLAPFVKQGTISLKTKALPDKRAYKSIVSVDLFEGGEKRTWEKRVTYTTGDVLKLDPRLPEETNRDSRGHLQVYVTLDTRIFINGKLTVQEGEIRDFHTPPLSAGQTYAVKVKFDYRNQTGRRIIRTKQWDLGPGDSIVVDNIEALSESIESPEAGSLK
jgi:uncharacterized protein (TIGR03000 family)